MNHPEREGVSRWPEPADDVMRHLPSWKSDSCILGERVQHLSAGKVVSGRRLCRNSNFGLPPIPHNITQCRGDGEEFPRSSVVERHPYKLLVAGSIPAEGIVRYVPYLFGRFTLQVYHADEGFQTRSEVWGEGGCCGTGTR